MSEFDDKLGAILSDQNAMSQIMALAQSLSARPSGEDEMDQAGPQVSLDACVGQDAQLLSALCPYLKEKRRRKLERGLELLRLLRMIKGNRE